jgi:hypothetical protein
MLPGARSADRRAALAGFSLALGACALPGATGATGAPATTPGSAGRHGSTVTGFIPTAQEPRPDGRLTLIWFYEPE